MMKLILNHKAKPVAATLILVFTFVIAYSTSTYGQESIRETNQLYAALAKDTQSQRQSLNIISKLVKATAPSVAHIEAKKRSKGSSASSGQSSKASYIEEAGSGVVIRYQGRLFVITNYHVIESSHKSDIQIEINGDLLQPTALRHDPDTDLSVMFLGRTDLPSARLGDSDAVEIGEFVVAIGSPFGLSHSVSYGIVSAKQRSDLELGPNGVRFQDFFQTDASINPGNSGGPLLNLNGEVIAINTAIASNSGGSDGIGFSIPIKMAMRVATDLIDHNRVRRGFLGVSLDARYNKRRALELGVGKSYGALVSAVTEGSPAATADFRIGDVILELDSQRVKNDSHLVTLVSLTKIGRTIPVKVFRQGKMVELQVTIKDREEY